MAGKNGKDGRELETAWIRELAGILEETGLTEIEIEKDAVRLRVSRQGGAAQFVAGPAPAPAAAPAADYAGAVKSPMVGTAYLSPSPDAAPFITEGAQVSEGQTIMIIEAMKTMNPIAAPRAGTVSKIIITDAQPVEFDDPLCIIE